MPNASKKLHFMNNWQNKVKHDRYQKNYIYASDEFRGTSESTLYNK